MNAPRTSTADPIAVLRATSPADADALYRAGAGALRAGREEQALPLLAQATRRHARHAGLWQTLGLCARAVDDLETACDALVRARELAPADPLIAHGAARARLEAGLPAVDDFERSRRLSPADGEVIRGLAASRLAMRDMTGAIDEIAAVLRIQPMWLDGHATLARLRRMAGDDDPLRSYREALARNTGAAGLWQALLSTLVTAERFGDIPPVLAGARKAAPVTPGLDLYDAIAADETGDLLRSERLFARLPADEPGAAVWQVRSLLRRGRIVEAGALAHAHVAKPGGDMFWPYISLAWRLEGDPRWQWLEGETAFVQTYDLSEAVGDLASLATHLRSLHVANDRPLDQSVRGGTQTDGPLFSRIEPEMRRLRGAVRTAIANYVAQLPPRDEAHPLLAAPRDRIRFAGSWSVRLTGGGFHADHVHTQGWISSALYIALPDEMGAGSRAGWLTLGASRALLPSVEPFREIEPKPGRLVLFPSTMWHGTRSFAAGERLTVAFDVARMG